MNGRNGWKTLALAAVVGLAAGCNESATGPEPDGRNLGILQMTGYEGPLPVNYGSTERDTTIRWDSTPDAEGQLPIGDEGRQPAEPGDWEPGDGITPPRVIAAPDEVDAGTPFEVTTYTFGGGCTVADGQDVRVNGNVVEVKPFDRELGQICTMILKVIPHTSTVTLTTPGEWVIRVTGRKVRFGDTSWEETVSAEKRILVK